MIRKLLKKGDLQWTSVRPQTVRDSATVWVLRRGGSLTFGESNFSAEWPSAQGADSKLKERKLLLSSQKGFLNTSFGSSDATEEDSNLDELDQPTDFKDLPVRIDWSAELPASIVVPRVDLHSLVLDFAAVSFLDISALKELKTVSLKGKCSTSPFSSQGLLIDD